jgi:hypothetical protein
LWSFVLQVSGIVAKGKITAMWFVVPGSGTGNLSGLRGKGGFEGSFCPRDRCIIGLSDGA